MSEQEQVDWQKVSESLTAWVSTVSEQLRAAFQQMLPVMQSISDAVWNSYRAAGMPYGDSHEGLMRWLEDMGEIKRHYQAIERIQQHHEMLISAHELGEKIRARREQEEGAEDKEKES